MGSVYFFITNENELDAVKQEEAISTLPEAAHSNVQTSATTSSKTKAPIQANEAMPEQESLLDAVQGQALMMVLKSFWQQCSKLNNCDEMLAQQQLVLDDRRYQLLVNFPGNQQAEQRLMGESLLSQDASLAEKVANVKTIREQVWGKDASLLFEQQDAYYDYRLSLADPDNRFNQTQNADDFMNEYNEMLEEWGDDLDSFSLNSDIAKYEQALQLIPSSMPDNEAARIKDELASQYLTANDQQAIANRSEQVDAQQQEISDYQQGLNQLEVTLANERATSKQALSDEDWQVYKADRLYQYRLDFFSS